MGRGICGPDGARPRSRGRQLAPGEVDKVRGEPANYQRFAALRERPHNQTPTALTA